MDWLAWGSQSGACRGWAGRASGAGWAWGPGYQTEANYLRVYVANLRRKLEPDPTAPRYLLTEPGMGYRFRP